jgi:hypothetical protein
VGISIAETVENTTKYKKVRAMIRIESFRKAFIITENRKCVIAGDQIGIVEEDYDDGPGKVQS